MKRKKNFFIITIVIIFSTLSACQLFLGPDPDSSPMGLFNTLWNDFNENYALFAHKGIDWNQIYNEYSVQIYPSMGNQELFDVMAEMLEELNDAHVWLYTPYGEAESDSRPPESFDMGIIRDKLENYGTQIENFLYGTLKNTNIGYIHIASFSGPTPIGVNDWARAIDGIISSLAGTTGLVLDIRNNGGGFYANMEYIASRFISHRTNFMIAKTKNGPGANNFSSPLTYSISPAGTSYTNDIVLLTNIDTVSAAEWFTIALLTQDHVTHAGSTTRGALSTRSPRRLINGWRYAVSVQYVTDILGHSPEGTGIIPAKDEKNTGWPTTDTQLEYAITLLQ